MHRITLYWERLVLNMNGINYSTLLGNAGFFNQTGNNIRDDLKLKGQFTNVPKKADNKQLNVDKDTFEYSGRTREVKAGYDKPKRVEAPKEGKYKEIDAEGIQEGIELSDAAKDLLAELRAKYTNMEIVAAEWSTDEEQMHYASLTDKDYSVLINPEALEAMAADPEVREKYESVLSGVEGNAKQIQEELGEDADKVTGFSVTIDKDGNITYALRLLEDIGKQNKENAKKVAEKNEEERLEEKRAERKEEREKLLEKIEASSIEELIAAVKKRLYPESVEGDRGEVTENENETIAEE